jgi:uncharacterized protein DUF6916
VSTTRRKFLKASSLFTLFSIIPIRRVGGRTAKSGYASATTGADSGTLANYSKASFESYLNSIFELQTANGKVAVTLIAVTDMPAPKGGECFALLFRGGKQNHPQGTYTLSHPALGTIQLLVVPAGFDKQSGWRGVATINRLSLVDFVNNQAPQRLYS